jgi:Na+-driven multidrug efflux pump
MLKQVLIKYKVNVKSILDEDNFQGLWNYLKVALSSMFSGTIEESAHNIQTLMTGLIGAKAQATQVIFMEGHETLNSLPYGVMMAACTHVGHHIGKVDVGGA